MDITEKKRTEERLKLSASVFEYASQPTMITDAANHIIAVNPAFTSKTGYALEEILGKSPNILLSDVHNKDFYKRMWEVLLTTGTWQGEIQNRNKDGSVVPEWLNISLLRDEQDAVYRHIAVFSELTDAKKAQETIERQATFDSLTGLPNRYLTMDRLQQMVVSHRRAGQQFAIMFLDLDNFKSVNDALGHPVGDDLLVNTALRLQAVLRDSDSIGRMGGDEFVILLGEVAQEEDIIPLADKIMQKLSQPLALSGHSVQTSASIGIAVYPNDGETPEALLKNADSAMYAAKESGRNQFSFFTQRMQEETDRRHWVANELGVALHKRHLRLHYQPIMDLSTMTVSHAEALLRWNHHERGYIPPQLFVEVAENTGMISQISQWVLKTGLEDLAGFQRHSAGGFGFSFNLSPTQFLDKPRMKNLVQGLKNSKLAGQSHVILEITESIRLSDREEFIETLHELRACGCKIAIDDFGTGYSSLSYLKRIPADYLKIDGSFIRDITNDPIDAATVTSILQIARAFGLKVIAEGVETEEQLEFLRKQGCDYAQGFLFSKAVPYKELVSFVVDRSQ